MAEVIEFKMKTPDPRLEEAKRRWEEARRYYHEGKSDRALEIYEALADEGFMPAYYEIGKVLEHGRGAVVQDLDGARYWYMRAIDAFDSSDAYVGMARLAMKGHEDAGSMIDAVQFLEKAVEKNNPYALSMLGMLHFDGAVVQKNLKKATQFYERAAAQGYVFPMMQLCRIKRQNGQFLSGWYWRLKTGWTAYRIARKDPSDKRLWNVEQFFR